MHPTIGNLVALLVVTSTLGWSQRAIADDRLKCQEVSGELSVASNGDGSTHGTLKHAGKLNGTTRAVFTSALTPTPNPNAFSYTGEFSIATNRGVLKSHNVGLFLVANGLFSEVAVIDSSNSTGNFLNATGVLYINGKTSDGGATFKADVLAEVCAVD